MLRSCTRLRIYKTHSLRNVLERRPHDPCFLSTISTPTTPPASSSTPHPVQPLLRTPTIFAPATGRGKSAISILRCSGPDALEVWHRMTAPPRASKVAKGKGKEKEKVPEPRKALLRSIVHPDSGEVLDEGVVLYFPEELALTSQPTIELQCHGSPALMALLLDLLPTLATSFRIAEPGEFTRLAFEAGKMDLTEVEGLHDLIEADTESQRKLAARQAGGEMRRAYDALRSGIIEAMSLVEALIDFGEDEGISEGVFEQARTKALQLQRTISHQLSSSHRAETIRSGIQLAIIGAPNAGKSSLLNYLAQREAAIVAPTPGTTRDVVEVVLDFAGFKLVVADTAGLRKGEGVGEVEEIGVERAYRKADEADVKIALLSLPELFQTPTEVKIDALTLSLIDHNTLVVLNKTDAFELLHRHREALMALLTDHKWLGKDSGTLLEVSVKDGSGMKEFVLALEEAVKTRFELSNNEDDGFLITRARHRRHLEESLAALTAFLEMTPDDIVLAAEELRYAALSIGRITGAVDVEEVLGEIFRGFCVGK